MRSNVLWRLVFLAMTLTLSQQSTPDAAWSSEANVEPTPVLHNHTQLGTSSTISDSFQLSPSFMESTPTPSMNETVLTIPLETPDQDDLQTLSLIDATTTNHVDESMWATSDTQIKMIQDTYSPDRLQNEDATIFANQSVDHFVLLSSDSAEDDTDDREFYTLSLTPVSNGSLYTSLTFVDRENISVEPTPTQIAQLVSSSIYNQTKDSDEATSGTETQREIGFLMKFQSGCIAEDANQSSVRHFLDEILRNSSKFENQNFTFTIKCNSCERVVSEIPVLLEERGQKVEHFLNSLKSLVGKANLTVESFGKSYVLSLVSVVPFPSNVSKDVEGEKSKDMDEYLPYVIIGGVFGAILLIVLVLMCGKCLCRCRKQKKPKNPDFEVPHLSLRPEDYILTRIPRPSTIYADNMAAPIMHHDDVSVSSGQACYNGDQPSRQSFETSVVPMDDIRDEDPYYRYKQHEYLPAHDSESISTELRTFNGKRLHHRSTATEDGVIYRHPYSSASTEKIHEPNHRRSRDVMGIDNQAYMRA